MTPAEDFFVLDLEAQKWSEIKIESNTPLQRHSHRIKMGSNEEFWMYGGIDELESSCQNLFKAKLPRDPEESK